MQSEAKARMVHIKLIINLIILMLISIFRTITKDIRVLILHLCNPNIAIPSQN